MLLIQQKMIFYFVSKPVSIQNFAVKKQDVLSLS